MTVSPPGKETDQNGKNLGIRNLVPSELVGFESLPEQYIKRMMRDGFVFNLLVVGSTGVGKTTLVDSLLNTKFPDSSERSHTANNVELSVQTHELHEKQIKLRLTVIETRGYGDQINKAGSHKNIVDYIDTQFEKYLQEELKIHRANNLNAQDSRVHCCIYMISPIGHGLKSIDLETMKALDSKVNIIPVIGKSDVINKHELSKLKSKIMSEIISNGIQIYNFPTDEAEIADMNVQMNGLMPFAVVGSHDYVRLGNKQVKARQYPWGTVQIENEAHCDFIKLREMLLRINMEDLRETTHLKHYELYRRTRLEQMGFGESGETNKTTSFQETFEARRNTHQANLKKKEEEIRQSFVIKIKEKEAELKSAEKELHQTFDSLKKRHAEEKQRIEDEKKQLEDEIAQFNLRKTSVLQGTSNLTLSSQSSLSSMMSSKLRKK